MGLKLKQQRLFKASLVLIISLFFIMIFGIIKVSAQQVDATYLNPKIISSNYDFLRFGNSSSYYAGFMYNKVSNSFGDGDDFTIFTYNNRDLVLNTGGRILLSGSKVGIGTFNPTAELDVEGDLEISKTAQIGKARVGVLDYAFNETPTYGVKIKTNLDFQHASQMPTIIIEGYNYGDAKTISLQLVYYVFNGLFRNASISSSGSYTPKVILGEENGKVVIFIDAKDYYQRFSIRTYEKGRIADNNSWYRGWTAVDEPLSSTNNLVVPYQNNFGGTVKISEISNQPAKLSVAGIIESREVKVSVDAGADYVFETEYNLLSLEKLQQYIQENKHLPEVPSAAEMENKGIELSKMNILLLKKVEELTLYVIELKKENEEQQELINEIINSRNK